MEVANTVGGAVGTRILRGAGSEGRWWTGSIEGLVEKATVGSISTALWFLIEIADPTLRHGRKRVLGRSVLLSLVGIYPLWQAQKLLCHWTEP